MPGPIDSAFVEIIVKIRADNSKSDLQAAVNTMINKIEGQLAALEEKGTETARKLIKSFKNINLTIGVRDAINQLDKIEDAAQETVSALRRLGTQKDVGFDTKSAQQSVLRLETKLKDLDKAFKLTDDGKINIDVSSARKAVEGIEKSITSFQTKIEDVNRTGVSPQVTATAKASLEKLEEQVARIRISLEGVDRKTVTVSASTLELDNVLDRLKRLDTQIPKVLKVDDTDVKKAVNTVERLGTQVNAFQKAFGSAFRRILAFGAIQGAINGVQTLFREGVRAAGAIQTVEVTLNRFFAQTRDLGQTSAEFFGNLRSLALGTPFEFEGLADTSRRILAMGVDADQTIEIMGDLTDAVSAVGGGQGEIDGVVRALSQLRSKGRVDLQDFRQISENLPSLSRQLQIKGIIDELNALHPELNATIGDFTRLRTTGLITGEVLTDGVLRAIKEIPGVAGAARAASRTLEGALSNLADFAKQEFAQAFGGLGGIIADELNSAFGSLTVGSELTPLAAAIREVIEAFGSAGETALPGILEAFVDLAPGIADLATAFGDLAENLVPVLSNLSTGALTTLTGLTGIVSQLTSAFGALPAGVQQTISSFATLAIVIPGAGEALIAPFKLLPATLAAVQAATTAVAGSMEAAAAAVAALGRAIKIALGVTAALVLFQLITSAIAKATQRTREFRESINEAARSLKEFGDAGDAALDFINQFRIAGEGVNIGGLEEAFDGLTSGEIQTALGTTAEGLSNVVEQMARVGEASASTQADIANVLTRTGLSITEVLDQIDSSAVRDAIKGAFNQVGDVNVDEFTDAVAVLQAGLDGTGVSLEAFTGASADAQVSAVALAEQFSAGAKVAFDAALSSGKFVFVLPEVADAMGTAAERTGDYVGALDDLKSANQAGARAAIAETKLRGANQRQIDDAIASNTKYTEAIDGSTDAEVNYVGALQDVNEALQQQADHFETLGERFSGFNARFAGLSESIDEVGLAGLPTQFLNFARAIDQAQLSTEDMNAIANELAGTLGQAFSGEELASVVAGFVADVDTFKGALDSVAPSIDDLQIEADSFSLNKFFAELEKIAEARTNLARNIEALLNDFGQLGADALQALFDAGLDKESFAIAIDQALSGSDEAVIGKLQEIVLRVASVMGPEFENLATVLAANGFTPERINEILGLSAFNDGITELGTTVNSLIGVNDTFERELNRFSAIRGPVFEPGVDKDAIRELNRLSSPTAVLPGIDVEAAVAEAATVGDQIGETLSTGVAASLQEGAAAVATKVSDLVQGLPGTTFFGAITAGLRIGQGIVEGIRTAIADVSTIASTEISALGGNLEHAFSESMDFYEVISGDLLGIKTAITDAAVAATGEMTILGGNLEHAFSESMNFYDVIDGDLLGISTAIRDSSAVAASEMGILGNNLEHAFSESMDFFDVIDGDLLGITTAIAQATSPAIIQMRSLAEGLTQALNTFNPGATLLATLRKTLSAAFTKILPLASLLGTNVGARVGEALTEEFGVRMGVGVADAQRRMVTTMSELGDELSFVFSEFLDLVDVMDFEMEASLSSIASHTSPLIAQVRSLAEGLNQAMNTFDPGAVINLQLQKAIPKAIATARLGGLQVGLSFGQGLAAGLALTYGLIAGAAARAVTVAEQAAKQAAKTGSPSKLFAAVGQDIGAGLAVGVDSSSQSVASAVTSAISGAAKVNTPADGLVAVLNAMVDQVNAAFRLLAGRTGVSGVFAGDPVRKFASGLVATRPIAGVFGEAGAEALLPLSDGQAAANVIRKLAPYIPSPGREAAEALVGRDAVQSGSVVNNWEANFNMEGPIYDPETFAAQAAVRLERRMTR